MMAAHDVNLADSDAEMFGHEPADGNVGPVVDRGGDDADDETAGSMPAHRQLADAVSGACEQGDACSRLGGDIGKHRGEHVHAVRRAHHDAALRADPGAQQ